MTKTTTARTELTELDSARTVWARTRSTGKLVTVAAFSTATATDPQGRWAYDRADRRGTPWYATDRRTDTDSGPFGTLRAARAWTYQQDQLGPGEQPAYRLAERINP